MTVREEIIHGVIGTIDLLLSHSSLSGSTRYYLVDGKMLGVRIFVKDPNDIYVQPVQSAIGGSTSMSSDDVVTKVMEILVGPLIREKIDERIKSMDDHAIATSEVASKMMDRISNLETRAGMMQSELKGVRDEMRNLIRREETSGQ